MRVVKEEETATRGNEHSLGEKGKRYEIRHIYKCVLGAISDFCLGGGPQ